MPLLQHWYLRSCYLYLQIHIMMPYSAFFSFFFSGRKNAS